MTTNQKLGGSSIRAAAAISGSTYKSTAALMASLRFAIRKAFTTASPSIVAIVVRGFAGQIELYAAEKPGNATCCGSTNLAPFRGGGGGKKPATNCVQRSSRAKPAGVPTAP